MPRSDSALDPDQMALCRALLSAPERKEQVWKPLAAAALLAVSALTFATAMIVAPSVTTEHVAPLRGVR